ncbi:hypothetical protein FWG76_00365 [Candidatus Saccharibacteria bacterium]|nr:hypothetical protein [Candidatus Saccharibacteria bacterium]
MEKQIHKNDAGEVVAQSYGDHEEFLTEDELKQMNGPEPEFEFTETKPQSLDRRRGEAVKSVSSFQDYKDRAKKSSWG